ncbi:MAG: TIGR00730 family Rossman fold protein [Alphaproteobacteria bacterium]|nr:TIGR00730 family Rossman fold protein [Alphaproteobacteria bacterium]
MTIESVCIYCGSSVHVAPAYKQIAHNVGTALARHNLRMIFGGGSIGLMGITADAALAAGGEVIGIIPEHIRSHEIQHTGLTELVVVDSMHIRKSLMAERSDAFVALPGGFGTIEELFEILTWKQIGLHTKPILIYNASGFWDPMLELIDHVITTNFAPQNNRRIFTVVTTPEEMIDAIKTISTESFSPEDKWK